MTVSRVTDVTFRRPQAAIGVRGTSSDLDVTKTLLNDAGQAKWSPPSPWRRLPTTRCIPSPSTVLTSAIRLTVAPTAEVASGLADAVNAEPLVRGQVSASAATALGHPDGNLMSGVLHPHRGGRTVERGDLHHGGVSRDRTFWALYGGHKGSRESAAYQQDGELYGTGGPGSRVHLLRTG